MKTIKSMAAFCIVLLSIASCGNSQKNENDVYALNENVNGTVGYQAIEIYEPEVVLTTCMRFTNISLPRTGIWATFGNSRIIHPTGQLEEGKGITPDLWVNGSAFGAVINLLVNP